MAAAVPLIDLTPWYEGAPIDRGAVAASVDEALRTSGFLLITGHRVPDGLRREARCAALEFFHLPEAVKRAFETPPGGRGWTPYGAEANTYAEASKEEGGESPPDLKESYIVGPEPPPGDEEAAGLTWFAPNVWPAAVPPLREKVLCYQTAMRRLADDLLEVFAVGLGLPDPYFTQRAHRATNTLSLTWYPAREEIGPPEPGQFRIGSHSDFGTLTILDRQPGQGALQVFSEGGEWVDAPYDPAAFTVNIGDMMARWTGDRWRSTRHRVLAPPPDASAEELLSLVYFFEIDFDVVVETLPAPAAGPNRYEPVVAGDYLQSKFDAITVG